MQVYFSHSYRDAEINEYFFNGLREHGFRLFADQKSPTWCVAKLERYIQDLSAFLSIVPRRATADGSIAFSPYIGYELSLARRSGLPRLIFVDDEVLNRHQNKFPRDAVPFVKSAPAADEFRHTEKIRSFKKHLEERGAARKRQYRDRFVAVISAASTFSPAANDLMDLLRAQSYSPKLIKLKQTLGSLDDVELMETIVNSEFCVFLLDTRITGADVILAMAHAHCIPSIRLQHDPAAIKPEAAVTGRIHWASRDHLVSVFQEQVANFRSGFVKAIDIRKIGTTKRDPRPEQLWDPQDGMSLSKHIELSSSRVREIVNRVRQSVGGSFVNVNEREICMLFYGMIRSQCFAYEHEPPTLATDKQAIRTTDEIWNDNAATCLDLAVLFGSLLKSAGLTPVIIVVRGFNLSHAVVGYKLRSAAGWTDSSSIGTVRAAVSLGELVVFEATGAVEYDKVVAAETIQERRAGNRTLEFDASLAAARRLIQAEVELRYLVEVQTTST